MAPASSDQSGTPPPPPSLQEVCCLRVVEVVCCCSLSRCCLRYAFSFFSSLFVYLQQEALLTELTHVLGRRFLQKRASEHLVVAELAPWQWYLSKRAKKKKKKKKKTRGKGRRRSCCCLSCEVVFLWSWLHTLKRFASHICR